MKSLYWTKRTPITQDNMQTMVANDIESFLIVNKSPEPPLALASTANGYEFQISNKRWHIIPDLTLANVQFINTGLYRISACVPALTQTQSYLNPADPFYGWWDYGLTTTPVWPCREGWRVGLRMDKNVVLTSQIYAMSGHTTPVYPEALIKVLQPQSHTFEVVVRSYRDGDDNSGSYPEILSDGRSNLVWGDPTSPGATSEAYRSYHMVQYIGV